MGYGIPSPWDTPSPNGIGKQAICPQKGEPYLQRGFIPRARARGHARTLRARALYGMAQGWIHVGLLLGYPIPREPTPGASPASPWAIPPYLIRRTSPWAHGPMGLFLVGDTVKRGMGPWAHGPASPAPGPAQPAQPLAQLAQPGIPLLRASRGQSSLRNHQMAQGLARMGLKRGLFGPSQGPPGRPIWL